MFVNPLQYEEALSTYSSALWTISLLRQYRPYLEVVPSMRRVEDSLITIPLPVAQIQREIKASSTQTAGYEPVSLPCDIVVLLCDPEWKIKTGIEIFLFINRPQEDFSQLLSRWRHTQVHLGRGYFWEMPLRYQHIFSEGAEKKLPLFVLFPETPERIQRGLTGACLPYVIQKANGELEGPLSQSLAGLDESEELSSSLDLDCELDFE